MVKAKTPSKAAVSRAAKVLKSKRTSKSAKSAAGRTLAKRAASITRIKSAPKRGNVSKAAIRRAVKSVSGSKKARSRRR